MIGPNSTRARGRNGKSDTTQSSLLLASIANRRVGCSRTLTRSRARYRSLRAIPNIQDRAGVTAPKVRPRSTRLQIPIAFFIH
jgi:hypothetical protein